MTLKLVKETIEQKIYRFTLIILHETGCQDKPESFEKFMEECADMTPLTRILELLIEDERAQYKDAFEKLDHIFFNGEEFEGDDGTFIGVNIDIWNDAEEAFNKIKDDSDEEIQDDSIPVN